MKAVATEISTEVVMPIARSVNDSDQSAIPRLGLVLNEPNIAVGKGSER